MTTTRRSLRRVLEGHDHLALPGWAALRPWVNPDNHAHGYPARIVDHAAERAEALNRYWLAVGR